MQLLVIRHAIAEEREEFAKSGRPDSERPLTDFGRRRMRRNAKGLRRVAPRPDAIGTSPYVRAEQTARIAADVLGVATVELLETLTPDHHPRDIVPWLSLQRENAVIAIVGHEPHLGQLITWFMSTRDESAAELKKGGAALIDFDAAPAAGKGTLRWLLTPAQLRAIAD